MDTEEPALPALFLLCKTVIFNPVWSAIGYI